MNYCIMQTESRMLMHYVNQMKDVNAICKLNENKAEWKIIASCKSNQEC